jgi:hypothetical protein
MRRWKKMNNTVVILSDSGNIEVVYQPEGVEVLIAEIGTGTLYTYKEFICEIREANEDGTLDIHAIKNKAGEPRNRIFLSIPADEISFYGYAEDDDYDFDGLEED